MLDLACFALLNNENGKKFHFAPPFTHSEYIESKPHPHLIRENEFNAHAQTIEDH